MTFSKPTCVHLCKILGCPLWVGTLFLAPHALVTYCFHTNTIAHHTWSNSVKFGQTLQWRISVATYFLFGYLRDSFGGIFFLVPFNRALKAVAALNSIRIPFIQIVTRLNTMCGRWGFESVKDSGGGEYIGWEVAAKGKAQTFVGTMGLAKWVWYFLSNRRFCDPTVKAFKVETVLNFDPNL